jgi:uncharacterized membrane protein
VYTNVQQELVMDPQPLDPQRRIDELEERVKALEWLVRSRDAAWEAAAPARQAEAEPAPVPSVGAPVEASAAPEFRSAPSEEIQAAIDVVAPQIFDQPVPAMPGPEATPDLESRVDKRTRMNAMLASRRGGLATESSTAGSPSASDERIGAPRPTTTSDLERTIGTRWFAAAGAVVVVIGVGLFLKLAIDQGWMKLIPPALKCLIGAGFGASLLIAGEAVRRKVAEIASVGLSAAGLGALYASAYSAYGVYSLVPSASVFILLAAISALGFFIAGRTGGPALAVLAVVGAYINPVIIGGSDSPLVLPAYLLALLGVGLALSARRPAPFRVLRGLVWWGTVLLGMLWVATVGISYPSAALLFLALFWAGVHAELAISARAEARLQEQALEAGVEPPILELSWPSVRFIATSFSTTAWAAVFAVLVVTNASPVKDWTAPAAGAVLTVLLSLVLAGHLRVLRDVPRTDPERLGAALAMQGGALLMAALALGLSGWTETIAWLGAGAAAVGAGRWIRSRGLDVYGLVLLSVATVRLVTIEAPTLAPAVFRYEIAGLVLTHWTLLMLAGAAAWGLTSALLIRFAPPPGTPSRDWWRGMGTAGTILAFALVHGSLLHPDADAGSVGLAWLGIALAATWLARAWMPVVYTAGVALLLASLLILIAARGGTVAGAGSPVYATIAGIVITRWMLLMLAAAAAWIGYALLLPRKADVFGLEGGTSICSSAAPLAVAVVLTFAGFVHEDARASSVALAWLGLSAVLILLHARLRRLALDIYGLLGLGAAAGAWCIAYPSEWMEGGRLPGLHPGLGVAALLVLAGAGSAWWLRRPRARATEPALLPVVAVLSLVLLFGATSLEVARSAGLVADDTTVRKAAVSIWWGLFAVGLIAGGFGARVTAMRHVGLALLAVATVKAAVIDLTDVPQLWRVVSFIGLGLLMLGVAVGYARVTARLKPA